MTSILPATLEQYQLDQNTATDSKKELGQGEFLELMMAQLKHQDPFKPMENGEFLGQMAQFSTVSGIDKMQAALEELSGNYMSNQTLEATKLVGQEVLVESNQLTLNSEGDASGRFALDTASGDVKLEVTDNTGKVIRHIDLGEHSAGRHDFVWDGLDNKGKRVPTGDYTVGVTAAYGEEYTAVSVLVPRIVDSVEFSTDGSTALNTTDGNSLTLDEIRAVRRAPSETAS
ncbi:MAG: flagellar hook assembly protein FlgD [Granulosicoccus sp.]